MSHERITCLASHPTEPCVATGDDRGRITLWYCFTAATVKKPVTSTLHWHAHQVNYMTFTADGVYLLSGGEEAVLVIWQLETGHRQYLPRLGSEIRSITVSPDQSLYALGHLDNSVRVFNALDLDIKQAIQGLKYAQTDHLTNPLSTGLVIEPRNHHVVLNGVPGTLQFYNAYTDRHVLELEVTPRNKASRTDDKEIVQPHVDLVAFWGRGEWMATVDSRDDGETTPELYLKFWRWDPDAQSYTLNTRVDAPHAVPITSLAFHPVPSGRNACPLAITTSKDKTFKIWHLVTQPGAGQNEYDVAWACRSIGVYRDYVPHHAAFSDDGSILAVAYGQIVTLWDPYTNTFQGVLVHPPEHRVVKRIEFLGGNSTFLVSVTRDHLYVWNLLTCTVWWSYQIKVDHLAADRQSSHFIVANNFPDSSDCRFLVFDPRTPIPVLIHSVPDKCRALAYLPRDDLPSFSTDRSGASSVLGHSNVIFLNQKWDLHVLGQAQTDEGSDRDETDARDKVSLASITPAPKTYFSDIFGTIRPKPSQEQLKAAAAAQQAAVAAAKDRAGKGEEEEKAFDLLSAPSHVMPSVATVFEAFMEGLLGKVGEVKEDAGRMEEDRDDEKDDEEAKEDQMDVDVVVPSANELSVPAPSLAAQDLSEQEVAIATKGGAFGFLGNQFLRQLTAGDKPNGHVVAKQAPSTPHYPKTNGVFANGKANGTLAHDSSDTDMEPEPGTGWNDKTPVSARTPKKAVVDEEARRVATPKKAVVDEARAVATPKSAGKKRKQ
ncbi:WD40-repeat-containing domain protein [Jimgerdemannia flammicorona]|uniref:WD40-repeat-containing domain protein n=1 Tax=Jimgerdemannia flammicorona TaxID=994334 RepID=A0A433Q5J5_9FUNG|nr:WD40-repeat-containing domain protein [Jimgerdemannia flammicorona]